MDKLLIFVGTNLVFLFKKNLFKIVDSFSSDYFGGDSYIDLENDSLFIRILFDRGQYFLDIKSSTIKNAEWFSIDLFRYLVENVEITKENLLKSNIDANDNILFLQKNIENIVFLLKDELKISTISRLKVIRKNREKTIFK